MDSGRDTYITNDEIENLISEDVADCACDDEDETHSG